MPERTRVELLGAFRLVAGDDVVPVPQAHQRIVLAALALAEEQGLTSEALLTVLWQERQPQSARKTLHGYIARLRRLLGADSVLTRTGGYVLNMERFDVDVRLARARTEAGSRATGPEERCRWFGRALDLFRGEPLDDVPSEALHRIHADTLRDLRLLALGHWAREQIGIDPAAAVGPLRDATVSRPHQESLWALLVDALAASGRRAEALDCYQRARRLLLDDLGIEPGPVLSRAQESALAPPPAPGPSTGARDGDAGPGIIATLARRCAEGAAIALVGPPGAGKSRIARDVVGEVRRTSTAGRPPVVVDVGRGEGSTEDPGGTARRVLRVWGIETGGDPLHVVRDAWALAPTLIVLDGVTRAAQYEPLLPVPSGGGLIVLTTVPRPVWPRLETVELPAYPPESVLGLLARGRALPPGGLPEATARVLDVVLEGLPAAVHALAERMADEPDLGWGEVVAGLQDPWRRLDLLTSRSVDVRAHLRAAYDLLPEPARRAFRLLGWLDARSFHDLVASAALDLPVAATRALLAELVRAGLLRADPRGGEPRYRIGPLGRSFAREVSDYTDDHTLRVAAVRRALRAWQSHPVGPNGPQGPGHPWGEPKGAPPLMRP